MNRRDLLHLLGGASLGAWSSLKGWRFLPHDTPCFRPDFVPIPTAIQAFGDPFVFVAKHVARGIGDWQMQHHDSFLVQADRPMKVGDGSDGVTFTNHFNVASRSSREDTGPIDLMQRYVEPIVSAFTDTLKQVGTNAYGYLPMPQGLDKALMVTDKRSGVTIRALRCYDPVINESYDRFDILVGRHQIAL